MGPRGGATNFKMQAYGVVFLGKTGSVEEGDKIFLHQSVLDSLMMRFGEGMLPHPLIFEIRNVKFGRVSHCGVLEFSAPKHGAFLPKWMMDNLLLEDGSEVEIRLKDLPKASKILFQPMKYEFGKLPTPRQTLEHALTKFTALTQGDTILIRHGTKDYHLLVKEVTPSVVRPPAVCVVDTSVSVGNRTAHMPTIHILHASDLLIPFVWLFLVVDPASHCPSHCRMEAPLLLFLCCSVGPGAAAM